MNMGHFAIPHARPHGWFAGRLRGPLVGWVVCSAAGTLKGRGLPSTAGTDHSRCVSDAHVKTISRSKPCTQIGEDRKECSQGPVSLVVY